MEIGVDNSFQVIFKLFLRVGGCAKQYILIFTVQYQSFPLREGHSTMKVILPPPWNGSPSEEILITALAINLFTIA